MRMTLVGVAALCASLAGAEDSWLPAPVAEQMAGQLYERVKAAAPDGPVPEARLRETSRRTVDALAGRFAAWGEKPLLDRAPALKMLKLPPAGQPHLDAMTRYFACAGVYEVLHTRNGFAKADRDDRILAAMAPSGFGMVLLYLRTPYLKAGGTDAKMEAFMTGPQLEPAINAIQDDGKVLDAAFQECRAVATWLVHE